MSTLVPATPARVRVFHNNAVAEAALFGYRPQHSVTEVFTFTALRWGATIEDDGICEQTFELLNVGDDPAFGEPDARALAYRRNRNRSLSVGDVIAVDARFYTCDSRGWTALPAEPAIEQRAAHGTTPLCPELLDPAPQTAPSTSWRLLRRVAAVIVGWGLRAWPGRGRPADTGTTRLLFVAAAAEQLAAVAEDLLSRGYPITEPPAARGDHWSLVTPLPAAAVTADVLAVMATVAERHAATFDGTATPAR